MIRLLLAAMAALAILSAQPSYAATDGGVADSAEVAVELAPADLATAPDATAAGVTLPAPSSDEPKSVGEAVGTGTKVFQFFRSRDFMAGFFALLGLLMYVLRMLVKLKTDWFEREWWRLVAAAVILAFGAELLTAYGAGEGLSLGMILGSLAAAIGAAFGSTRGSPGDVVRKVRPAGDGIITGDLR